MNKRKKGRASINVNNKWDASVYTISREYKRLFSVSAVDLHKIELKIERRIQTQRNRWVSSGYRKFIVKPNETHRSGYLSVLPIGPWECTYQWSPRWLWLTVTVSNQKMACMKLKEKLVFRFWARHIFHSLSIASEEYAFEFEYTSRSVDMIRILVEQLSHFREVVVQFFKTKKIILRFAVPQRNLSRKKSGC